MDNKKDSPINVLYQGPNNASGLVVQMDVYAPNGTKDDVQSGVMTELGTRGKYQKSFTPTSVGDWHIEISDDSGGRGIRNYAVGEQNMDSLAAKIDAISITPIMPPMIG